MKFECNCQDFSEALQKVIRVFVSKKESFISVLDGVKIKAENENVFLSCTDMELKIKSSILANVLIEGEVVVPTDILKEYVKKIEDDVIFETENEGKTLKILNNGSFININCLDIELYPEEKVYETDFEIEIESNKLKNLIRKSIFCASSQENVKIYKGCFFIKEKNILKFVGVDGKRISVVYEEIDDNSDINFKGIIPFKTADEIEKLLKNKNDKIKFKCSSKKLIVEIKNTIIYSNLIYGDFFDFNRFMEIKNNIKITVEKKLLKDCLDRISLVLKQDSNNAIKIEINEEEMKMTTSSTYISQIVEKVPIFLEGKDIVIGININFLKSCLDVIDEDIILIELTSSSQPIFVEGKEDKKFKYLFLPLTLVS